jgi:predicted DCC family thiol-disulfide oxidoreductase YuxK
VADPPRPVLLYDGDCRLCRFAARTVARLDRDGELRLLPLDDAEAAPLLRSVPQAERHATWRLVTGDVTVGHGRGAVELVRSLGLTRPAARILRAIPPPALDSVYELVARHRSRLGRFVPDGPAPRRYP